MKCPYCGSKDSQVLESRAADNDQSVRRRRSCEACERRFTTHERINSTLLWVIKKGGNREPYDGEKVKRGILRAVEKRPVSMDAVDDVVERVTQEMMRKGSSEVSSRAVGSAVVRKLKRVDKVAWLRFASVYMEFEDLDDFINLMKK